MTTTLQSVVERVLREYLNVAVEPGPAGLTVICPYHDDHKASGHLKCDESDARFKCFACDASKSFVQYVSRVKGLDEHTVRQDIERLYGYETDSTIIPIAVVEAYHKEIFGNEGMLTELRARGLTDTTIKRYRLGFNSGRIQIPVANRYGLIVNLRKYKPGAESKHKMRNQTGCGKKPRLYPIEQLKYDTIVLCGGEIKALAVAQELNSHNIGAISTTTGEGKWYPEFNEEFRGKRVYVCGDIDLPGQYSARRRCNFLSTFASWVGNLLLPLDAARYPKGDVNDYIGREKGLVYPLLDDVPEWVPEYKQVVRDDEIHDVTLNDAVDARFAGRRVRLRAQVAAIQQAPYAVPRTLKVLCDRSQEFCATCPVHAFKEGMATTISPESREILELVNSTLQSHTPVLMNAIGIPKKCKVVSFETLDFHHVEDIRLSPQLSLDNRSTDRELLPALVIGGSVELNEAYQIEARIYPHPRTQTTTILVTDHQAAEDTLSTYECTEPSRFEIFRTDRFTEEAIAEKLEDIYADFEANVTNIYCRSDLHFVIDLAYHSLLNINFRGREEKGWVEVLIIGDSAQGKTETAMNLMRHYRLGEKVDCKNASVAGLIGGLQQLDKRWFATWGAIPTHDRRLVILEELKGLSIEVISKLTEMRSSGRAQIPKIERRERYARTRLVALSNPRDGRRLEDRAKGIFAVKDLVGNLEDIRRFDLCLGISGRELDQARINDYQIVKPEYPHKYTSDLCHELVLFAWSTKQMRLADEQHLIKRAQELASGYGSGDIPLIEAGSVRSKLLRLATALACRVFSVEDHVLVVKPCHVDFMFNFLRKIYDSPTLEYRRFVESKRLGSLHDRDKLQQYLLNVPYAKEFIVLALENNDGYTHEDIQDWTAWDLDSAKDMTSFLVRKGAIRKRGRGYFNTPGFIELLKELLAEDKFPDIRHKEADNDF